MTTDDVEPGDIVSYVKGGRYTAIVESVAPATVMVKGPTRKTAKRIHRSTIKEIWRWHQRVKTSDTPESHP